MFYSFRVPLKGAILSRLASKWIVYLCLLILSTLSIAQNIHQENTLTLTSAIKRSLRENPSLKVFKFRQDSLDGQHQSQNLKPAYDVGFEAEKDRRPERIEGDLHGEERQGVGAAFARTDTGGGDGHCDIEKRPHNRE